MHHYLLKQNVKIKYNMVEKIICGKVFKRPSTLEVFKKRVKENSFHWEAKELTSVRESGHSGN